MTALVDNILIVTFTVAAALLFMAGLNRLWSRANRKVHNDLIGWQLSILGTTYAVILGFMLFTVWTTFGAASLNTDLEANAVVALYHVADGLPEPQRSQLQTLARSYVDTVIEHEWPQMNRGEVPERTTTINIDMWKAATAAKVASPTEINAQDHALSQLSSLTEHRLTRIVQSTNQLPTVLWCVLIVGGVLTILSASTFGSESTRLQTMQVFSFTLLIALTLVAIADIHRPFSGLVHVENYPFRRAQEVLQGR